MAGVAVGGGLVATGRRLAASALFVLASAGLFSAVGDSSPEPIVEADGPHAGVATSDGRAAGFTMRVVAAAGDAGWSPARGHVFVRDGNAPVAVGEPVIVAGTLESAEFRVRSGRVAGVIADARTQPLGEAINPLLRLGNRLRRRVVGGLEPVRGGPAGALLTGFLIGDTSGLPAADEEALRTAGLSHFVAVSGSNVALFLALIWVLGGPLAWSPRRRAVAGLFGLALFVVVTRWEPSVIRAAGMAAVLLIGRMMGWAATPWTALGWSITGLLLIAPSLGGQVGFQLSVAATAGILAGAPLWIGRRPRWAWATLGATASAQLAVAPILLARFGSVPLLAPLSNLVSAPLVALATVVGGVGAIGRVAPLAEVGAAVAGVVLTVARFAADLPQLAGPGAVVALVVGWAAVLFPPVRPLAAVAAVAVTGVMLIPAPPPAGPTVSFLDVGQGDATLFRGPSGESILVDGGPDPATLRAHLDRLDVNRIDLLVVSHRHADHVTGLLDLAIPVGAMWYPDQQGAGGAFDELIAGMAARGVPMVVPDVGETARVGVFRIEVLAPLRRYASPNDGSIVLSVAAAGVDVLMSGDIEAIAQAELGPLPSAIMKVPHQGAATSDTDWLAASAPSIAVISVGLNDFGHPSAEVIETLKHAGSSVLRTDQAGTITFRLDLIRALPSAS